MPTELEENLPHVFFIAAAFPDNEVEAIMPITVLLQQMALYTLIDFRAAVEVSYSLTDQTREQLETILTLVCKAFRKADADSFTALEEHRRLSVD